MPAPKSSQPITPAIEAEDDDSVDSVERRDPIKHIENHTSHLIILPCTDTFPNGVRLIPGLNSVPMDYFEELNALTKPAREVVTKSGLKKMTKLRYPGRDTLDKLLTPVRLVTARGEDFGPQITIYEDVQDRPDGPPAPMVLPVNVEAAKAVIRTCSDRKALERWSKAGNGKGEVAQFARAVLESLGVQREIARAGTAGRG